MSIYKSALICVLLFEFINPVLSEDLSDRVSERLDSVVIGAHQIDISNWRGEVTLKGRVNSSMDRIKVLETVNSVNGVDKVVDLLEVNQESDAQNVSAIPVSEIQKSTEEFLDKLPVKGAYSLQYQVLSDKLLVTGELPAGTNKQLLIDYWQEKLGLNIEDRIELRAWPTDSELKLKVKSALAEKQGLDLTGIEINVVEGVVTLSGKRANHFEADQLATIVWMVEGVRDFKSEITFKGSRDDPMSAIDKSH